MKISLWFPFIALFSISFQAWYELYSVHIQMLFDSLIFNWRMYLHMFESFVIHRKRTFWWLTQFLRVPCVWRSFFEKKNRCPIRPTFIGISIRLFVVQFKSIFIFSFFLNFRWNWNQIRLTPPTHLTAASSIEYYDQ